MSPAFEIFNKTATSFLILLLIYFLSSIYLNFFNIFLFVVLGSGYK